MNSRKPIVVFLILAFTYFLAKTAFLYTATKFGSVGQFIIYFLPVIFFSISAYILLNTDYKPTVYRFVKAMALSAIGYYITRFLYVDTADSSLNYYFDDLNNGSTFPRHEDFRLELLLVFIANLAAFVIYIKNYFGR